MHLSPAARGALRPLVIGSQAVPVPVIAPLLSCWSRLRARAEGADRRARLLLPRRHQPLRRPARRRRGRPPSCCARSTPRAGRRCAGSSCRARCPSAFTGMKIAVAVAVIGAVFAEWSGAERRPRPRAADRQRAARDRARVRCHPAPVPARRRALRPVRAARAARRRLEAPIPPRRTMTRLTPLLVLAAAAARRLRREVRAQPGLRRPRAVHGDARLLPERRPRRHLRRAGGRGVRQGGPRRDDPAAARPRRARCGCCRPAAPTWRSPTSPSCCWRATRAPTLVGVGALVQKPLTSLISIGDDAIAPPRRPARQEGRHRRHPVPVGLPARRSSKAPGVDPAAVEEVNVGFNLTPAMISGRVDATLGVVLELRGRRARAAQPQAADPARWSSSACRPTTS